MRKGEKGEKEKNESRTRLVSERIFLPENLVYVENVRVVWFSGSVGFRLRVTLKHPKRIVELCGESCIVCEPFNLRLSFSLSLLLFIYLLEPLEPRPWVPGTTVHSVELVQEEREA